MTRSTFLLLVFVLSGGASAAPGDASHAAPTPTAARPASGTEVVGRDGPGSDVSRWSQWVRGAGAAREEARARSVAWLQHLHNGLSPASAVAGGAEPAEFRLPIVIDFGAASTAATSPLPARPCPACEAMPAEPTVTSVPESGSPRPPSWRLGVDRTTDDPNPAAARPTRLRVTVAREWSL
jgi:hypothetical protein